MTKDNLIKSIMHRFYRTAEKIFERDRFSGWGAPSKSDIYKIITTSEQFLRNAYNRGFKDGKTTIDIDKVQRDSFDNGYRCGRDDIHNFVEAQKYEAYIEGLRDAWETARKVLCLYPSDDMAKTFGYEWVGDWMSLFDWDPSKAMAMLSEYEAERRKAEAKPTNGDIFRSVFGIDLSAPSPTDINGRVLEYNGVPIYDWLNRPYKSPKEENK